MTPPMTVLTLYSRGCRCQLGTLVRKGEDYFLCATPKTQVWTSATRWERRTSDPVAVNLSRGETLSVLGCQHARIVLRRGGAGEGFNAPGELNPDILLRAARNARRRREILTLDTTELPVTGVDF